MVGYHRFDDIPTNREKMTISRWDLQRIRSRNPMYMSNTEYVWLSVANIMPFQGLLLSQTLQDKSGRHAVNTVAALSDCIPYWERSLR